jgi:hypothetical protein
MAGVTTVNLADQSLTRGGRLLTGAEKHDFTIGHLRQQVENGAAWDGGLPLANSADLRSTR